MNVGYRAWSAEDWDKYRGDLADYKLSVSFSTIDELLSHWAGVRATCEVAPRSSAVAPIDRKPVSGVIAGNFYIGELCEAPENLSFLRYALVFVGRDGYPMSMRGFVSGSLGALEGLVSQNLTRLERDRRALVMAQDLYPHEYPDATEHGTNPIVMAMADSLQKRLADWLAAEYARMGLVDSP